MTVSFEWHTNWTSDIDDALSALPIDSLSEPELLQALWELNSGVVSQKICIVRNAQRQVVGVVPIKRRGKASWQLLSYYNMPYAKLLALPDYVGAVLQRLSHHVDCPNIVSAALPDSSSLVRHEESWVVDCGAPYDDLMQRRKYAKDDRYTRRRSEKLTTVEDKHDDLPLALDEWKRNWLARNSPYTAVFRDEMQVACEYLQNKGRLKTFSLYDGDKLAAFSAVVLDQDRAYNTFISVWDQYRDVYAGMRVVLDTIAWACRSEYNSLDLLRTSSIPKHKWTEPKIVGFRLVQCPLGSKALGQAIGALKDFKHDLRIGKSKIGDRVLDRPARILQKA